MSRSNSKGPEERFTIALAKRDFKFSSAHFTVFGPRDAERLHGHNYQVSVELEGSRIDQLGLLVEVRSLKQAIRGLCEFLDSQTLLPTSCPYVEIEDLGTEVSVRYRDRRYRFPREDVILVDDVNISMEVLARYFWRHLADTPPELADTLMVEVAETDGQSCRYRRRFD